MYFSGEIFVWFQWKKAVHQTGIMAMSWGLLALMISGNALAQTETFSAPYQGWIDSDTGADFFALISSVCSGTIYPDRDEIGAHECAANGHAIYWGYACPADAVFNEIDLLTGGANTTSSPYLDRGRYAVGRDGDVIYGIVRLHPLSSSTFDYIPTACIKTRKEERTLEISGPESVMPDGLGVSNPVAFVARVRSNGAPVPSVALTATVSVTPNSGNHEHHDINRPTGTLTPGGGYTDARGEFRFSFKPSELAGIHTIQVHCSTCTNATISKEVQVKVPSLAPISPNPPLAADNRFTYALTSVDATHAGNGRYHHNQYYLNERSSKSLNTLIEAFGEEGWGTVALNDASLPWGGRYDIRANWLAPHAGHRDGREIDISFSRGSNPVSRSKQNNFYKKFCESLAVQVPFSILHHFVANPHFHVYLERQTACWKSEK